MKERPILMSAPMVRAILDRRKTQTRRICKEPVIEGATAKGCKYGTVGDQLWVKETFLWRGNKTIPVYRADMESTEAAGFGAMYGGWKPSIFMPRKLGRITLEITSLRVERLQDIAHYDCEKEGLVHGGRAAWSCPGTDEIFYEGFLGYKWLWEKINGKGSWALNPWVWVISFKRIMP